MLLLAPAFVRHREARFLCVLPSPYAQLYSRRDDRSRRKYAHLPNFCHLNPVTIPTKFIQLCPSASYPLCTRASRALAILPSRSFSLSRWRPPASPRNLLNPTAPPVRSTPVHPPTPTSPSSMETSRRPPTSSPPLSRPIPPTATATSSRSTSSSRKVRSTTPSSSSTPGLLLIPPTPTPSSPQAMSSLPR